MDDKTRDQGWRGAYEDIYRECVALRKELRRVKAQAVAVKAAEPAPPPVPAGATIEPIKWLRPLDMARRYSISRSFLYVLMDAGKVKSVVMRMKGNVRGARLVSVESMDAYLESLAEE